MSSGRWSVLGEKVDPDWGPHRARAVHEAIARRAERRRATVRATFATASAAFLLVGVCGYFVRARFGPLASSRDSGAAAQPTAPAVVAAAAEPVGVTPLSPDTVLEPLPDRQGRGFNLRAGGARFSVPHDARHPFVVAAGTVTIEDLGTAFTVRYVGADRLDVAVEEGRVRVRAAGTDTELAAGATLRVPLALGTKMEPPHARTTVTASSSWRPLAERGAYEEARRALRRAGAGAVRDDASDLLLAADAARLSGHPAEAVPYLRRVMREHARDPGAGVAAFTLGRVLLDELERPGEAVDAFAAARAAGGPLAEDALAREVEAASRAGDVTRSHELALLYRRLYPNGRRTTAVSRFGNLD